jgi:hypothetical protein
MTRLPQLSMNIPCLKHGAVFVAAAAGEVVMS